MTADAKVGLLLGLVFIVIIAFLVNGLPNMVRSASAEDVLDTTSTVQVTPDVVIDRTINRVARDVHQPPSMRVVQPEPVEQVVLEPLGDSEFAGRKTLADMTVPVADLHSMRRSTQVITHVVKSGETLAKIAVQYYGKEKGNKLAVIEQLYQANKSILESPDKVRVGDKLMIPPSNPIREVAVQNPVIQKQQSGTFMESVRTLFGSAGNYPSQPSGRVQRIPQPQYAAYVVKAGDSLWKISDQVFGDATRYKELIKLNRDVIRNENDVKEGLRLKVPKSR